MRFIIVRTRTQEALWPSKNLHGKAETCRAWPSACRHIAWRSRSWGDGGLQSGLQRRPDAWAIQRSCSELDEPLADEGLVFRSADLPDVLSWAWLTLLIDLLALQLIHNAHIVTVLQRNSKRDQVALLETDNITWCGPLNEPISSVLYTDQ